ncbi:MAG: chemotaxis response regulator protein-glutamate methylesterase [Candidatus Omnitrophota bacterium]
MIRVLVIDDSAFMCRKISDILNTCADIQVIGTARTGAQAIQKIIELKPNVVTLDIVLPEIDGLTVLSYIMHEAPTPVVVVSAHTPPGSQNALKALELGAVDILAKPSGEISIDIDKLSKELIDKVKVANSKNVRHISSIMNRIMRHSQPGKPATDNFKKIIAIGASTGGPKAIKEILPYFPENIPAAFLIVQHMPPEFTKSMANRLNWVTKIEVKEAEEGDVIKSGRGYLAPGDYHMVVKKEGSDFVIHLNRDAPVHSVRPSVTVMMNSAAEAFGPRTVGVLLTGMGQDGVEGMRKIKEVGGKTLAEDESTCVVFGMPKMAIKEGIVDKVVPLSHMGIEIVKCIESL